MNATASYNPTPFDIEWTRQLIEGSAKPVTVWGIPGNKSVYRIDRQERTFTLIAGPKVWANGNLFEQLTACATLLGYTVREEPQAMTADVVQEAFGKGKTLSWFYRN